MKHRHAAVLAILTLATFCAASAQDAKTAQPAPPSAASAWKQGDSRRARMTSDSKTTIAVMGQNIETLQTQTMEYTVKIAEVDKSGNAAMEMIYDAVTLRQSAMGQVMEYDSRKSAGPDDPMAKAFGAIIGYRFSMKVSPRGEILDVKGGDALVQRMMLQTEMPPGPMRDSFEESMRRICGDEAMRAAMNQGVVVLPPPDAKDGAMWTTRQKLPMAIVADHAYTLTGRRKGGLALHLFSKISPDAEGMPFEMGPLKLRVLLSGEQEGTLHVEEGTGWVLSSRMTQNLSGTMQVDGAQDMAASMGASAEDAAKAQEQVTKMLAGSTMAVQGVVTVEALP